MIDYINDQIHKSEKIISKVKRLDLGVKPYSREKYIRFLKQELELERDQTKQMSQFNILDSNRPRIEVIYFMLKLKEMGIFKFDNDSILSKFIDRHCRYDKGKRLKTQGKPFLISEKKKSTLKNTRSNFKNS